MIDDFPHLNVAIMIHCAHEVGKYIASIILTYMHMEWCDYIFILDLTPGVNGLGKDSCKTRRESIKFCNLVRLISDILR